MGESNNRVPSDGVLAEPDKDTRDLSGRLGLGHRPKREDSCALFSEPRLIAYKWAEFRESATRSWKTNRDAPATHFSRISFGHKGEGVVVYLPGEDGWFSLTPFAAKQACALTHTPFSFISKLRAATVAEILNDRTAAVFVESGDATAPADEGYVYGVIKGRRLLAFRSMVQGRIFDYELTTITNQFVTKGLLQCHCMWRTQIGSQFWIKRKKFECIEVGGIKFQPVICVWNSELGAMGTIIANGVMAKFAGYQAHMFPRWDKSVKVNIWQHLSDAGRRTGLSYLVRQLSLLARGVTKPDEEMLQLALDTPPGDGAVAGSDNALHHALLGGEQLLHDRKPDERFTFLRQMPAYWGAHDQKKTGPTLEAP